ncbi:MAG: hypothetical protein IH865_10830 [Chloroflexi bacterium]|nr:hypothetical protein [Chloroflexota bacterium]
MGDAALESSGSRFPDETRQVIDDSGATLFGATNRASWDALFYLRWGR